MKMHLFRRRWFVALSLSAGLAAFGCGGDDDDGRPDAGVTIDAIPPGPEVTISPVSADFGSVVVGATSSAETFTVSNAAGAGTTNSLVVQVFGDDAGDFDITTDNCSGEQLAGGDDCTVVVEFSPGAEGSRASSLRVTAGADVEVLATLTGDGIAPGELDITPTPQNFGGVVIGSSSAGVDFTVTNTGGSDTGTITATLSGGDATAFSITADDCSGETLGVTASCIITVEFSPASAGAKTSTLRVSASPGGTVNATLNGIGLNDADLNISPLIQDFGSVVEGQNSANVTFTVSNGGDVATGTLAVTKTGTNQDEFDIVTTDCNGATLAAGATCTIIVRFSPALGSTGLMDATLTVTGTPGGSVSAQLSGNGLTLGFLQISPTPHNFGSATVGTVGASQVFTVENLGDSPTGVLNTSLGGNHPTDFPVVGAGNSCQGVALAGGASCTIALNFSPTSPGLREATLTVTGTPGGMVQASLSGTGLAPAEIQVTPINHDFGSIATGKQSESYAFTITNVGDTMSGDPVADIGGTDFTQFAISADGCTAGLAGGASCTVEVIFTPTVPILPNPVRTASLEVTASPGGSDSAVITGTAITPADVTLDLGSYYFDEVVYGGSSLDDFGTSPGGYVEVTVTNNGTETSGALNVAISGPNQAAFVFGSTCQGTQLGAGASCIIEIAFQPTLVMARTFMTATLSVTVNPGGPPPDYIITASLEGWALPKLQICAGAGTFHATTQVPTGCDPLPHNFGSVVFGNIGTSQDFTVRNSTGRGEASHLVQTDIIGTNASDFTATGTYNPFLADDCNGNTLTPGEECDMEANFYPQAITLAAGARTATIDVDAPATNASVTAGLQGTALGILDIYDPRTPAAADIFKDIDVNNPDVLEFGDVPIGGYGAITECFRVLNENIGDASTPAPQDGTDVEATEISTWFTPAGDFAIVSDDCRASGGTGIATYLEPFHYCTICVAFNPLLPGSQSDSITVSTNPLHEVSSDSATVTGVGRTTKNLIISEPGHNYGSVAASNSGGTYSFTVTNTGWHSGLNPNTTGPWDAYEPYFITSPLNVYFTGSGCDYYNWNLVATTCDGAQLDGGDTCNLTVAFDVDAGAPYGLDQMNCTVWVDEDPAPIPEVMEPDGSHYVKADLTGKAISQLTINPLGHVYLDTPEGGTSSEFLFEVENIGSVAVTGMTAGITAGDVTHFLRTTNGCPSTLTVGGTCNVGVTFTPQSAGLFGAILTVAGVANDGAIAEAELEGKGLELPDLVVRPHYDTTIAHPPLDARLEPSWDVFYGTVPLNGSAQAYTMSVKNEGEVDSEVLSIIFDPGGTVNDVYDPTSWVLQNDGCSGNVLAPNQTCTFDALFQPVGNAVEGFTAYAEGFIPVRFNKLIRLLVTDVPAGGQAVGHRPGDTLNIRLNGLTVESLYLSSSPSPIVFADTVSGRTSAYTTVTVTNTGGVTATGIDAFSWLPDFSVNWATSTCDPSTPLNPGFSCDLEVAFTPLGPKGTRLSLLFVYDESTIDDPDYTNWIISTVQLTGNVLAPANIAVNPTANPYEFGEVVVGAPETQIFTLTNNSDEATGVVSTGIVTNDPVNSPDYNQFAISSDNCNGNTIPAGGTCTFVVTCDPIDQRGDTYVGQMTIAAANGAAGTPISGYTISLWCDGRTAADLSIGPTGTFSCGTNVAAGLLSGTYADCGLCYVVANGGTNPEPSGELDFHLSDPANFEWDTPATAVCGSGDEWCTDTTILGAGESCAFRMYYVPEVISTTHSNDLYVSANPGGATATVTQTGTSRSALSATGSGAFGSVQVEGSGSGTGPEGFASATFTITNALHTPTTGMLRATLGGTNADQFAFAADNCTFTTLLENTSCTVTVHAIPTSASGKSGSLTVTDGTANKTITIPLSVTGTLP